MRVSIFPSREELVEEFRVPRAQPPPAALMSESDFRNLPLTFVPMA